MDAVLVEQGKVGIWVERLGPENARAVPRSGRQQLHGDDRVEAGLPRNGPQTQLSPALLSVKDAAERIQVSTQTVRRMIKAGMKIYRAGQQIRIAE